MTLGQVPREKNRSGRGACQSNSPLQSHHPIGGFTFPPKEPSSNRRVSQLPPYALSCNRRVSPPGGVEGYTASCSSLIGCRYDIDARYRRVRCTWKPLSVTNVVRPPRGTCLSPPLRSHHPIGGFQLQPKKAIVQ
ncbi:hypothetical protein TNCT_383651 [Trichonephila clavata]|uniref:Uncharacterized protein n=1 Tax=Trichonephila clavata TaxID=2740835 RepID=A0A8X6LKD6_TRICU|nr:hypothetical protein TNCT_383651 [Trichonephila clavata]